MYNNPLACPYEAQTLKNSIKIVLFIFSELIISLKPTSSEYGTICLVDKMKMWIYDCWIQVVNFKFK